MKQQPLFTQVRIARPTDRLEQVTAFYREGLGLPQIGSFQDHEKYSGIMLGMPDERYHLEFTQHRDGSACPAPTKDNLLVFYYPNAEERDKVAGRLQAMGYGMVAPENMYWETHGITIEDPDGWRVVLMKIKGFRSA